MEKLTIKKVDFNCVLCTFMCFLKAGLITVLLHFLGNTSKMCSPFFMKTHAANAIRITVLNTQWRCAHHSITNSYSLRNYQNYCHTASCGCLQLTLLWGCWNAFTSFRSPPISSTTWGSRFTVSRVPWGRWGVRSGSEQRKPSKTRPVNGTWKQVSPHSVSHTDTSLLFWRT